MHINSIKIINFKKFRDETFDFNRDVNIFVGDNNAGKSTILEALEIALNYNYRGRPFTGEFSPDLFNQEAVDQFLVSDKSSKHLPKVVIEAYILITEAQITAWKLMYKASWCKLVSMHRLRMYTKAIGALKQ